MDRVAIDATDFFSRVADFAMGRPSRPRKVFPYYKAQVYDDRVLAWMDARKAAFDTLQEAELFLQTEMASRRHRILIVEERTRRVLKTYSANE